MRRAFIITIGTLMLCGACGDESGARLGAAGEVCGSDLDCRGGLLCLEDECTEPGEVLPERRFEELCIPRDELPPETIVLKSIAPQPSRVGQELGLCVTVNSRFEAPDGTRVAFFEAACDEDTPSGLRFEGQGEADPCGRMSQTTLEGAASVALSCTAAGTFDLFIAVETLNRFDLIEVRCLP